MIGASHAEHFDQIKFSNDGVVLGYVKVDFSDLAIQEGTTTDELKIIVVANMEWDAPKQAAFDQIIKVAVKGSLILSGPMDKHTFDQIPRTNALTLLHLDGLPSGTFTGATLAEFHTKRLILSRSHIKGIKFEAIVDLERVELVCENDDHTPANGEIFHLFPHDSLRSGTCTLHQDKWLGSGLTGYEQQIRIESTLIHESGHRTVVGGAVIDVDVQENAHVSRLPCAMNFS